MNKQIENARYNNYMQVDKLTCIFFNAFILLFTGFGKLKINEKTEATCQLFAKKET